ncbi:uncharacterized protein LOC130994459 [Salvia miltiorrhiza]|uniref:uncharacterized protein LOC130994452 n=1 Tax=Salvia miltiorrhiza TaxID=226208 RepID=UPI0025AC1307|nr:uncharacterized protein LOC130994452 [Salvia miltiorrhiza]XP_057775488.1 uncharacterized protein LOC130994459 [Salvia miltiorrhiza]
MDSKYIGWILLVLLVLFGNEVAVFTGGKKLERMAIASPVLLYITELSLFILNYKNRAETSDDDSENVDSDQVASQARTGISRRFIYAPTRMEVTRFVFCIAGFVIAVCDFLRISLGWTDIAKCFTASSMTLIFGLLFLIFIDFLGERSGWK